MAKKSTAKPKKKAKGFDTSFSFGNNVRKPKSGRQRGTSGS